MTQEIYSRRMASYRELGLLVSQIHGDLWARVLKFMTPKEIAVSFTCVCKEWEEIAVNETKILQYCDRLQGLNYTHGAFSEVSLIQP